MNIGIQPSPSSAATLVVRSPSAASQIGSSGTGGRPSRSGRAAALSSRARSPASSARTLVVTSRSLAAGRSKAASWKPSTSALVLVPSPST
jgi:hypothetical protein